MRVLMVNTTDSGGGAAIACRRLHEGLRAAGVDSVMLVAGKTRPEPHTASAYEHLNRPQRFLLTQALRRDATPLTRYPVRTTETWSLNRTPNGLAQAINALHPVVVHLHWVGGGYLPLRAFSRIEAPIVWTLHDMWAFTGGCHHSHGCDRYTAQCGACPQLGTERENDLSRRIWQQKHAYYPQVTVVTPSHWLADCARRSSLLGGMPVEVIPNGLDTTLFRPYEKRFAREVFGLPQDRSVLLFGASSSVPSKGLRFALEAASRLGDDVVPVAFGSPLAGDAAVHHVGMLRDEVSLALLYSAADVLLVPSLAENLPNTIMEAMACGTPTVAFRVGGIPDMVEPGKTGYLASPEDIDGLVEAVRAVLADLPTMRAACRQTAEARYTIEAIAARYREIYTRVLA